MKLDKYSVYIDIVQEGEFFIGSLYDINGTSKFEVIKKDKQVVKEILEEKIEDYLIEEA